MSSTHTAIEWTDAVWNPMTGCTQISAGCDHCYAKIVAERRTRSQYLRRAPVKPTPASAGDPFAPRFWEERLEQPLKWKRPMRVFVDSMSDVFHSHFSLAMIQRVFEVMNRAHWHQFQILTKRPERAARLADDLTWTANIWIGTSIEDMRVARRADYLRRITQASVRFISAEPLLGPLEGLDLAGIQWVIGGGESGAGYRPVDLVWARGLRDRCADAGVPFFWKQWGGRTAKSGGRVLDERTWDEYPESRRHRA
jgi:protein gp37